MIDTRNPRTGQIDYRFQPADAAAVANACAQLRQAQAGWWSAGIEHRVATLRAWKREIEARQSAIEAALTADTGRRRISREEIGAVLHFIDGYAAVAPKLLAPVTGRSSAAADVGYEQQYVPYPVVGVISPWNFPLVLSFFDTIPALLAGCAALVKPSEVTPRFVEPLRESIAAVPDLAAILAVIQGDATTGATLVDNVDAVVFTGSIATGQKVGIEAARNFIPAFLELGGKDPAIVLASADLERAATSILRSSVYNTGQVCYAIERVYVDETVAERFTDILARQAQTLELSHPDMDRGHLGPFIFARQAEILREQLRDATGKGARIVTGGAIEEHGGGLWMRATVVADVDHTMKVMTEETFGPVVPVMKFANEDEAVRLANDTVYGLSGAVFAGSIEEATRVARRVDAGGISVNDADLPRAVTFDAEKMAFRKSGMGGSRYGAASLLRYVRKKAIISNEGAVRGLDSLAELGT